ncbi:MAG: YbaB/EbfC family nucleoid-associated protein [Oscillibacter sp.]|nr:YbaB/EbfC family nucleoid-associated protein [Oscillibacter sp.]
MGYSARRGFSSGSMKPTGAQRQAEVQQKIAQMQEAMSAAQEAVEAQVFTASVGGGAVEVSVNGKKEVQSIQIQKDAVDPEDVEMLQDMLVSAVNEALRQADEAMEKSMDGVTGGLNLNLGQFGL